VIDLRLGDCRDVLCSLPSASVDAIITDPPYPEITREYGRWTEAEWHELMRTVVGECRRILKPHGSAVFILQPNCARMGSMRLWLWDFVSWAGREWNLIEDVYWWNTTALPKCGQLGDKALPRPSAKMCVWLGDPDCFRSIGKVLKPISDYVMRADIETARSTFGPSGWRGQVKPRSQNSPRMYSVAKERGGSTPFNVLPIANAHDRDSAGTFGHGAGTPFDLMDWWIRYISPEGGIVCDPFMGSGTCGLAALGRNRSFLGIESFPKYFAIAERRIHAALAEAPLFA
jgi:DNA modification methylase